ncbi:hypothetical protein [Streptomyces cyslabdanicus]|uniref:hypothetical protein n=1 Tax=Streptomyces cyslabdanicus TaxID=1470456 RepID=UPI004044E11C
MPQYPDVPEGETQETWLRKECLKGLARRYGDPIPAEVHQAWQTLRTSAYADAFRTHGALEEAPDDPAVMRQRLAEMRAHLPALATRIDTTRAEAAQDARHEAVALRAKAHDLRAAAEQFQAEQQLRRQISGQAPQWHAAEEAARDAALQQERRQSTLRTRQTREQAQRGLPHQHPRGGIRVG